MTQINATSRSTVAPANQSKISFDHTPEDRQRLTQLPRVKLRFSDQKVTFNEQDSDIDLHIQGVVYHDLRKFRAAKVRSNSLNLTWELISN